MRDEGQLAQAIQNLVRNAIEAMPNGGLVQIEIDVRPTAEVGNRKEVCIAVIDRGAGIEPSKLDRIWRARCRNSVACHGSQRQPRSLERLFRRRCYVGLRKTRIQGSTAQTVQFISAHCRSYAAHRYIDD